MGKRDKFGDFSSEKIIRRRPDRPDGDSLDAGKKRNIKGNGRRQKKQDISQTEEERIIEQGGQLVDSENAREDVYKGIPELAEMGPSTDKNMAEQKKETPNPELKAETEEQARQRRKKILGMLGLNEKGGQKNPPAYTFGDAAMDRVPMSKKTRRLQREEWRHGYEIDEIDAAKASERRWRKEAAEKSPDFSNGSTVPKGQPTSQSEAAPKTVVQSSNKTKAADSRVVSRERGKSNREVPDFSKARNFQSFFEFINQTPEELLGGAGSREKLLENIDAIIDEVNKTGDLPEGFNDLVGNRDIRAALLRLLFDHPEIGEKARDYVDFSQAENFDQLFDLIAEADQDRLGNWNKSQLIDYIKEIKRSYAWDSGHLSTRLAMVDDYDLRQSIKKLLIDLETPVFDDGLPTPDESGKDKDGADDISVPSFEPLPDHSLNEEDGQTAPAETGIDLPAKETESTPAETPSVPELPAQEVSEAKASLELDFSNVETFDQLYELIRAMDQKEINFWGGSAALINNIDRIRGVYAETGKESRSLELIKNKEIRGAVKRLLAQSSNAAGGLSSDSDKERVTDERGFRRLIRRALEIRREREPRVDELAEAESEEEQSVSSEDVKTEKTLTRMFNELKIFDHLQSSKKYQGSDKQIKNKIEQQAKYAEIGELEKDEEVSAAVDGLIDLLSQTGEFDEKQREQRVNDFMVLARKLDFFEHGPNTFPRPVFEVIEKIYNNEQRHIFESAKREESLSQSGRKRLMKAGLRVGGYGALGAILGLATGGVGAGIGLGVARVIDRFATEKGLEAKISGREKRIKAEMQNPNSERRKFVKERFLAELALAKQMHIDTGKPFEEGFSRVDRIKLRTLENYLSLNTELSAGDRKKMEGSLMALATIERNNNSLSEKLTDRGWLKGIWENDSFWFRSIAKAVSGSGETMNEKVLSAGFFGFCGVLARELPVVRRALLAFGGMKAGEVAGNIVLSKLGWQEKKITAADLKKDEGLFDAARRQLLSPEFRKSRPQDYVALKAEVEKKTEEKIARAEELKKEVGAMNERLLETNSQAQKSRNKRLAVIALSRVAGAGLGLAFGELIAPASEAEEMKPTESGQAEVVDATGSEQQIAPPAETLVVPEKTVEEISSIKEPIGLPKIEPAGDDGSVLENMPPVSEPLPAAEAVELIAPVGSQESASSASDLLGKSVPDHLPPSIEESLPPSPAEAVDSAEAGDNDIAGEALRIASEKAITPSAEAEKIIYEIGGKSELGSLDQVLRRVVVQEFNLGPDNKFDAVEAARAENVLANLRILLGGDNVAGLRAENLRGIVSFSDNRLEVSDPGRFEKEILSPLFERAEKNIQTADNVLEYVNRTSLEKWQEMFKNRPGGEKITVEGFSSSRPAVPEVPSPIGNISKAVSSETIESTPSEVGGSITSPPEVAWQSAGKAEQVSDFTARASELSDEFKTLNEISSADSAGKFEAFLRDTNHDGQPDFWSIRVGNQSVDVKIADFQPENISRQISAVGKNIDHIAQRAGVNRELAIDLIKNAKSAGVEGIKADTIVSGGQFENLLNSFRGENLSLLQDSHGQFDPGQFELFHRLYELEPGATTRILRITKDLDWGSDQEVSLGLLLAKPDQPGAGELMKNIFGQDLVIDSTKLDKVSETVAVFKRVGGLGGKVKFDFATREIEVGSELLSGEVKKFKIDNLADAVKYLIAKKKQND